MTTYIDHVIFHIQAFDFLKSKLSDERMLAFYKGPDNVNSIQTQIDDLIFPFVS